MTHPLANAPDLLRRISKRGAARLDHTYPLWWEHIAPAQLAIDSFRWDPIGQLSFTDERADDQSYSDEWEKHFENLIAPPTRENIQKYGFGVVIPTTEDDPVWRDLTACWLQAIRYRYVVGAAPFGTAPLREGESA